MFLTVNAAFMRLWDAKPVIDIYVVIGIFAQFNANEQTRLKGRHCLRSLFDLHGERLDWPQASRWLVQNKTCFNSLLRSPAVVNLS